MKKNLSLTLTIILVILLSFIAGYHYHAYTYPKIYIEQIEKYIPPEPVKTLPMINLKRVNQSLKLKDRG